MSSLLLGPNDRLAPGVHQATISEVVEVFTKTDERARFRFALDELLREAQAVNASEIILGGSFLSSKPLPNDLDAVIILPSLAIPDGRKRGETYASVSLDLLFCADGDLETRSAFIELFSGHYRGQDWGVVSVILRGGNMPERVAVDPTLSSRVIQFYGTRIIRQSRQRALITVHGMHSSALWYPDAIETASASGWMVRPFAFGWQPIFLLLLPWWTNRIVGRFRKHVSSLSERRDCDISIIAHSFGAYIVMKYLRDNDRRGSIPIDGVVLSAAIVNKEFDPSQLEGKVGRLLNLRSAPLDWPTKWASRLLPCSKLFGDAGFVGFKNSHPLIEERNNRLFTHNNILKRDTLRAVVLPWLEAHTGILSRERGAAASRKNLNTERPGEPL